MILDAFIHWLRLMAAIVWVGGTLFTSIIVHPVLRTNFPLEERAALGQRAAFWGRINALLLLGIVFCAALLHFNPW